MKKFYSFFCFACISIQLLGQCNFTVNAGPDITVCNPGDMGTLNGRITGNPLEIEWEPVVGLANPRSPVTKVTVQGPMEYILKAKGLDPRNLIVNGNFSGGRSGFTTDYAVGTISCYGFGYLDCEGTYDVINNPQLGHTGFAPCGDHTTGSGNMMVLNGAASLQNVWCQTVAVMPDMDYVFTVWVTAVVSSSPPILQISINGSPIGPTFNSSGTVCRWEKYEATWNSGSASSASICILNENTATGGNDFAIDDISLFKICEVRDTVMVDVEEIIAEIEEPEIVTCKKPKIKLNAKASTQRTGFTYKWTTFDGKIVSGDKSLEPEIFGPGTYTLLVCSPIPNCCKEVSVKVDGNVIPPKITLSLRDTLGCGKNSVVIRTRSDNPDVDFEWKGPNGFESMEKDPIVFEAGKYVVKVEDGYECISYDSINVFEKKDNPKIELIKNNIDCIQDTSFLKVTSSVPGSTFEWKSPSGQSYKNDQWAVVDSGKYVVITTTPSGCIRYDTILVSKNIDRPRLQYLYDTIDCLKDSAQITVTPADTLSFFEWKSANRFIPRNGLNITAFDPGNYRLEVTGINGCKNQLDINIVSDTVRPYLSFTVDTITCKNPLATIQIMSNDSNAVLRWLGPDPPTQSVFSHQTSKGGNYSIVSLSSNGCTDSVSIEIKTDTLAPKFSLKNDTLSCNNPSRLLAITGDTSGTTLLWNGPQSFTSNLLQPKTSYPGVYVFNASYENGCSFTDSLVLLGDFDKPQLTSKDDTLSCTKDSIQLNANANNPFTEFEWKTPGGIIIKNASHFVKQEGSYILKGRNPNGCEDSILVNVFKDIRRPDLFVASDTITCTKSIVTLIAQSNRDTLQYEWFGPNGFNANTKTIQTQEAGKYSVTIFTKELCKAVYELIIAVDTVRPVVQLKDDTLTCIKTSTNLSALNPPSNLQYLWNGPGIQNESSQLINVSNGGLYTLQVSSPNGCTAEVFARISMDTLRPTLNTYNDTINCKKTSVIISPLTNGNQIVMITPSGNTVTAPTLQTSTPGIYFIESTGKNGCLSKNQTIIYIDTIKPTAIIDFDTINCRQRFSTVTANSSPASAIIDWKGPNGFSGNQASFNTNFGGEYTLQLELNNGCNQKYQFVIPVDTIAPKIIAYSDSIDCNKKEAEVFVTGDLNGNKIIWKDASQKIISSDANFKTNQAGWYNVEIVNQGNACNSMANTYVYEDPEIISDVNIETIDPICGQDIGQLSKIEVVGGHSGFEYSIDQKQNWQSENKFLALKEGSYILYVRDKKRCEYQKSFSISPVPFIETYLPPITSLELGDSTRLQLTISLPLPQIKSISWYPKTHLSCNDCKDPFASPPVNTEYVVTVIDTNGCLSTSRVLVKVELPEIWVPNVFSPNSDNLNDGIWIFSSQDRSVDVLHFSIFDRWGEQVFTDRQFKPNDPNHAWDGRYKNKDCLPGVYVYIAEIQLKNGDKRWLKGDITLIR